MPRRLLALSIMAISLVTLCEYAFERDLYIDRLFGTSWAVAAAPHRGRMGPQVAVCFLIASIAMLQLARRMGSGFDWILPPAAASILLIGLVSLGGRFLSFDIVYDWNYSTRIAPHTAGGLVLLAIGLAQPIYRRTLYRNDDVLNDTQRILAVS